MTGAAAGMGAATARAFAAGGASVVLTDIDKDAVERTAQELSERGGQVLPLACDVSDERQVAAAVDRTVDESSA
ncbi:SDR family oxidoreductase [Nonomuraea jabiensis]|uniref:SDR family oxidoreductase n=1 Tax=Nonomuraea jabiensis TaxID=882448 RepID=UPI003D74B1F3